MHHDDASYSPNQNIIYPIYIEKGAQLTSQNQNTSLVFTTTESTVLSSISDIKIVQLSKGIVPGFLALVIVLFIITYISWFSLVLI